MTKSKRYVIIYRKGVIKIELTEILEKVKEIENPIDGKGVTLDNITAIYNKALSPFVENINKNKKVIEEISKQLDLYRREGKLVKIGTVKSKAYKYFLYYCTLSAKFPVTLEFDKDNNLVIVVVDFNFLLSLKDRTYCLKTQTGYRTSTINSKPFIYYDVVNNNIELNKYLLDIYKLKHIEFLLADFAKNFDIEKVFAEYIEKNIL